MLRMFGQRLRSSVRAGHRISQLFQSRGWKYREKGDADVYEQNNDLVRPQWLGKCHSPRMLKNFFWF